MHHTWCHKHICVAAICFLLVAEGGEAAQPSDKYLWTIYYMCQPKNLSASFELLKIFRQQEKLIGFHVSKPF